VVPFLNKFVNDLEEGELRVPGLTDVTDIIKKLIPNPKRGMIPNLAAELIEDTNHLIKKKRKGFKELIKEWEERLQSSPPKCDDELERKLKQNREVAVDLSVGRRAVSLN